MNNVCTVLSTQRRAGMYARLTILSVLFAHLLTITDLTEKASANVYFQHTFLFVPPK